MLYVALATEDGLSEAVGKRLLSEIEYPVEVSLLLRRNGYGYLRSGLTKWCELATQQPVVLLTDLDRYVCPLDLIRDWFGDVVRPNRLIFRIAVREIESWLLADHDAMKQLIGQKGKLPTDPDALSDPKAKLLALARNASKDVRLDLIRAEGVVASQGVGYNARLTSFVSSVWNPERAASRSASLRRARERLREFVEAAYGA